MNVSIEGLTLHVRNVERSVEFYSRIPGASPEPSTQAIRSFLRRGRPARTAASWRLGFHIEMTTDDVDALYEQLREAGIEPVGPPKKRRWGERTFEVVDPDGNRLEFQ